MSDVNVFAAYVTARKGNSYTRLQPICADCARKAHRVHYHGTTDKPCATCGRGRK